MQSSPASAAPAAEVTPPWVKDSVAKMEEELVAKHGESQRAGAHRGLQQVAEFWRAEDGDATVFEDFVRVNFAGDQATLDTMFNRLESLLEQLGGHMHEINREFRQQSDLDAGPVLPFDEIIGGYDPSAHVSDDFFQNKIAFVVLLNFPLTTLDQRLNRRSVMVAPAVGRGPTGRSDSPSGFRRMLTRALRRRKRRPAAVHRRIQHLDAPPARCQGARLFPPKMRLLSHWNLRDEIKADYADASSGLAKQRMIQQVMERIVTQTIPSCHQQSWVRLESVQQRCDGCGREGFGRPPTPAAKPSNAREPDTRYATLQKTFFASEKADPYSPTAPNRSLARFDEDREIPEARVRAMLEQVLTLAAGSRKWRS